MNSALDDDLLVAQLRRMIGKRFRFDENKTRQLAIDQPLFDGTLGLDSLDALEFGMQVEEEFGVMIDNAAEARKALATLRDLAAFLRHRVSPPHPTAPAHWPAGHPALS